ncbi:MAG: hypothetical protein HHJ09_05395 [Glaciimonas sp.]|nr:hypothetical protein [Glaciimonas sp.]
MPIHKCILARKVIYSDIECAPEAKSTTVKIENSAGIVSPDRTIVNATIDRIIVENRKAREEKGNQVSSLEIPKKVNPFCSSYKKQIQYLDEQATQGNTSYVAGTIRQARLNIRKLRLEGNCYKNN